MDIEAQFVFLPTDYIERCATVAPVEQIALDFFFPAKQGGWRLPLQRRSAVGGTNIMIVEAPEMPGLNIPHFQQELNRTGKFLEGYFQHTATGFFKAAPFVPNVLEEMRSVAEDLASNEPRNKAEARDSFLLRSLLSFDRLHPQRPFRICIEPRNDKDDIREIKALIRATKTTKKSDTNEDEFEEIHDLDQIIELLGPAHQEQIKATAGIGRARTLAYENFVVDTLKGLPNKPTKVLIPRNVLATAVSQDGLDARLSDLGIKLKPPVYLGAIRDSWENNITLEFLRNPNRALSRHETLVYLASTNLVGNFSQMEFLTGPREVVFNTFGSIAPEELEAFMKELVALEESSQNRELLNFYGRQKGMGMDDVGIGDLMLGGLNRVIEESTLGQVKEFLRHQSDDSEED